MRIGAGNLPIPSAVLADYDTEIILDIFLKLGSNNCSTESFEGLHDVYSIEAYENLHTIQQYTAPQERFIRPGKKGRKWEMWETGRSIAPTSGTLN